MSNLRKTLGLDKPKTAPQGGPKPANPPANEAKQPKCVEADPTAVITQTCGHKIGVRSLRDRACPSCVAAKRAAKHQEKRKRRERWGGRVPPRLPDNSRFDVVYDAKSETWMGTLAIDGQVFEETDSAVFGLLTKLDQKYRASLETR